jgi:hypothetical protein
MWEIALGRDYIDIEPSIKEGRYRAIHKGRKI